MVGDGRLGEVEERHQLADAHLPGMLAEHVDELQADRVAQCLGDRGHPLGLVALNVRVDDRLAARVTGRALGLRGHLQIDRHLSTYIY